jgi:transglutaminase-like putative cysteine protease
VRRALLFMTAVTVAAVAGPATSEGRETRRDNAWKDAWRIAPEPSWIAPVVTPATPAAATAPARAEPDPSVAEYLLDDQQVRVSDKTVERFRHMRYRPRSPTEVEDASQLELEFNPAYERLTIHYARIVRAGRASPAFTPGDVKVVQRERDLEHRIYDGTLSALIFLRDVRVGDVVDYAYTVDGANPTLAGKYVARFSLADDSFTAHWRHRIVLPAARSLSVKTHGIDIKAQTTTHDDWREYLWERRDVAPLEREDQMPSWFAAQPWVDVSEFASWAEVAALFDRIYPDRGHVEPGLAAEVARLRAKGGTAEDTLLEATRFVQDEIRYLGLEIGLGGHKPSAPSIVLERRFGDCKDKSVLLISILTALGFDARPALVNTSDTRLLDDTLPSPFAFDHAIVRVTVGGESHFIDATVSYQRGPLAARQPPDFERALIVAPDTRGLVSIPRPRLTEPAMAVKETFTIPPGGHAADLEVETTLRFDEADRMRGRLATRTKKEIGREYLNYYAEGDPTVTLAGELEASDDERRNVLVLRERYHFSDFWRESKRELIATALTDHLGLPHYRLRRTPYALEFPLNVSHTTIVRLPVRPDVDLDAKDIGDDHLRFRFDPHVDGQDLVIRYDLQTLVDSVPPDKADRFFKTLEEIRRRAGYVLDRPTSTAGSGEPWFKTAGGVAGFSGLGIGAAIGLFVGARASWRWRRRRALRGRSRFAAGEVAATAIDLASEDDLDARVATLKCPCGRRYQTGRADEDQRVRYQDRALLVRTAQCEACSQRRAIFFTVSGQ